MSLRNRVKKLLERLTDTHIYRVPRRGLDYVKDIANFLPKCRVDVVFDVGANVGKSSMLCLAQFPESRIYCFEPASDTFRQLQDNLKSHARVNCFQLALGSSTCKGEMVMQGSSDMFYLLGQSKASPPNNHVATESVEVITLDEFCLARQITHINYLKIDTEGGDLDVLKGAVKMFAEQRIDLVKVEAGMNFRNSRHVPFEMLKEFLESYRYFVFGMYEQVNEWPTNEPHLRRADILFISYRMIEMNRSSAGVAHNKVPSFA